MIDLSGLHAALGQVGQHAGHIGDLVVAHKVTELARMAVGPYLLGKGARSFMLPHVLLDIYASQKANAGTITAEQLNKILTNGGTLRPDASVAVSGRFFPSLLLSKGWWQRDSKSIEQNIPWDNRSLQNWLFAGFEQWAPSWEITDWPAGSKIFLAGQIGTNDEADSIPVFITSDEKAKRIRRDMENDLVVNVIAKGALCDDQLLRSQLDAATCSQLSELGILHEESQYYLLVTDDENHRIEIDTKAGRKVDFYSGYLWQCLVPNERLEQEAYKTPLPRSYFVWEHTNFADRDVIRYNYDSLDRKIDFIKQNLRRQRGGPQELSGEMTLLQHLMPRHKIFGEAQSADAPMPVIPARYFVDLLKPGSP